MHERYTINMNAFVVKRPELAYYPICELMPLNFASRGKNQLAGQMSLCLDHINCGKRCQLIKISLDTTS